MEKVVYSVIQLNHDSFGGDVVLDCVSMASMRKESGSDLYQKDFR